MLRISLPLQEENLRAKLLARNAPRDLFDKVNDLFYVHTQKGNRHPHYFDYTFNASARWVSECVEKRWGDRADVFLYLLRSLRQTHRRINSPVLSEEVDQSKCTLIILIEDGHQKGCFTRNKRRSQVKTLSQDLVMNLPNWPYPAQAKRLSLLLNAERSFMYSLQHCSISYGKRVPSII